MILLQKIQFVIHLWKLAGTEKGEISRASEGHYNNAICSDKYEGKY